MQKKLYDPWMLSNRDIVKMSTWEYKKLMTEVIEHPGRPTMAQMIGSFFDGEESFLSRVAIICALAAWALVAWRWAGVWPIGYLGDAMAIAVTATLVAAVTTIWSLSGYISAWEKELPVPRHYRPRA